MDRDVFLKRVGTATLTSVLPSPPAVSPELPDPAPVDLIALFRARAQEVNAVVHGPVGRHGVPRAVVGIAAGHDAARFMAWDDLPASGVSSALQTAGLERIGHVVPAQGRREHNLSHMDLDVGVTGALAGLAESGSVVLRHGSGRPRMASIVPEVHIALLDVDRVVRTLAHWAHENPDSVRETTNLVLVTGPSRTGDIEQRLNLGVHGPRHVHIVMIR
ncbi:MAG: lactate utilization protein [Acidimicrobiia bacterium]